MKKDRKKGRLLKKELKELRTEINAYKDAFMIRSNDFHRERENLHRLMARVVTIKHDFCISDLESRQYSLGGIPIYDIVKDSLISDFMNISNLRNMIKVEQDPSYIGLGTRYVASLECLVPLYNVKGE